MVAFTKKHYIYKILLLINFNYSFQLIMKDQRLGGRFSLKVFEESADG